MTILFYKNFITVILTVFVLSCGETHFLGGPGKIKHVDQSDANENLSKEKRESEHPSSLDSEILAGILKPKTIPQFALLVNDLSCSFCHLSVHGDVVSTRSVEGIHSGNGDVLGKIDGKWFAAANWNPEKPDAENLLTGAPTIRQSQIVVVGGVKTHYSGKEMPKDSSGKVSFPEIDFSKIEANMTGSLRGNAPPVNINKVYSGNLYAKGSPEAPLEINGSVLVKGDLVIKGTYTGVGTIYVTGNIYIPFDLLAKKSPFPYPDDETAALAKAKSHILNNDTDGLALAAGGSVLIADLEKFEFGTGSGTAYTHEWTKAKFNYEGTKAKKVYDWFPGAKVGYDALYEAGYDCAANTNSRMGSFNVVEAFLYAHNAVTGVARRNSYAINGGVIADGMHIIARSAEYRSEDNALCADANHPIHKRNMRTNHVSFDWRMRTGLSVLEEIRSYFPNIVSN